MRECASRAAGAYPRVRAYMSQPILYLDPSAPDVTCALHARPIDIASLVSTSRDQVSWDRFLAERLTRLKPVQTLNQHIPAPICRARIGVVRPLSEIVPAIVATIDALSGYDVLRGFRAAAVKQWLGMECSEQVRLAEMVRR
jgi:hypothetical protein